MRRSSAKDNQIFLMTSLAGNCSVNLKHPGGELVGTHLGQRYQAIQHQRILVNGRASDSLSTDSELEESAAREVPTTVSREPAFTECYFSSKFRLGVFVVQLSYSGSSSCFP